MTADEQEMERFREQCRRQMARPIEERIKYGFYRIYRPVMDDAPWRSFESMQAYRDWCEANLPEYLGHKRPKSASTSADSSAARKKL
jgi:hypothetical protein